METQYFCNNKDRWKLVRDSDTINGIDYLEVASTDQCTLRIFFLHSLPGQPNGIPAAAPLTKDNIIIVGGVRIKNVQAVTVSASQNVLTIVTDKAGDFSTYTLYIAQSVTDVDTPPDGFDEQLSSTDFSFKINCNNEFDCDTSINCAPPKGEDPDINYLAKDYASFNRLMFDRLGALLPGWRERNAADLQVALVEMLAYMGDHLSYYQDAVATEAYIGKARRRISLKRHARLLDYAVHDGCNARAWVQIQIAADGGLDHLPIPAKTVLLTNTVFEKTMLTAKEVELLTDEHNAMVFETMHEIVLHTSHNKISFYTWGDNNCCLSKGSTSAVLVNHPALFLIKGDVLVFEELYSPVTGSAADSDPAKRHAVRLKTVTPGNDTLTQTDVLYIEWDETDTLPFSLCLTSKQENTDAVKPVNEKSVARGNIVLVDHGITKHNSSLVPASPTIDEAYYPQLPSTDITSMVAYNHFIEINRPAAYSIQQDPHEALAAVDLLYENEKWEVQRDLLASDRFAAEFVVEIENSGEAFVRFGDGKSGKKPGEGFTPVATYRKGNGKIGNVGRETINAIEWKNGSIQKVCNLLPAFGGINAETMEEVRQFAPQAFRTQKRAVTAADYVEKTVLHPQVQKAAAKFYWTGSWYTVYIIVDRKGGEAIDEDFKQEIIMHLEQYRMAGYDLEIKQPVFVPLHVVLNVCVKPGYFRANVKKTLIQVFGKQQLNNDAPAFFHPDNFTFGQPVYLSAIYQKAMSVEGVASVEIKKLYRWGKQQGNEIKDGILQVGELEIIRVDSDPNFPENGKIDFIMLGGL